MPRRIYQFEPDLAIVFENPGQILGPMGRVNVLETTWIDGSVFLRGGPENRIALLADVDALVRCDALPANLQLFFGEALAVYRDLRVVADVCAAEERSCAASVFRTIDVSEDGRLSEAELVRLLRVGILAARFLVDIDGPSASATGGANLLESGAELGGGVGGGLLASLLAPTLLGNVFLSYDFDGDGFLSPEELLQDRESLDVRALIEDGLGPITLGDAERRLADELSGALRTLPQVLGGTLR
jgi:hypothetical protein